MVYRRHIPFAVTLLALFSMGCTTPSGIDGFWDELDVSVTAENYNDAEDRFAGFAELTADAPYQESAAALDKLLDKLTSDEVSYIIYSEWMVAAFHSILSPARNPGLFARAVDRFGADGIISQDELRPLRELADKDRINLPGEACTLPELTDAEGRPVPWSPGSETVFAVVNLDCATCVGALNALRDQPGRHIALCFGYTPAPSIPGWEYCFSPAMDRIFDLEAAPFWFSAGADGKIATPYSPIPHQEFATPELI